VAGVALVLGFTMFGRTSPKTAKPSLRVVGSAPIKVRGNHFRPDESVRVSNEKRSVRTRANGNGLFVVTIPGSSRCDTTRVLARGKAGSYVVVKLLPAPMCMPARSG
jgi:hypothetical protein